MTPTALASSSSEWTHSLGTDQTNGGRLWIQSPEAIVSGISFRARYVGSLEVLTSMRSMTYGDRSQVARECINRVCDAAGMKTPSKKRKIEKRIAQVLGLPSLLYGGEDVTLVVDVNRLQVISLNDGTLICSHELPDISFASGGDADTVDFIAYVGKSSDRGTSLPGRWCYVIECGSGVAQECVATIGQAFDLKFKQFLKASSTSSSVSASESERSELGQKPIKSATLQSPSVSGTNTKPANNFAASNKPAVATRLKEGSDIEYYNDMPGKKAPLTELEGMKGTKQSVPPDNERSRTEHKPLAVSNGKVPEHNPNLIDLNSPSYDKAKKHDASEFDLLDPLSARTENKDPFDLTQFDVLLQPILDNYSWYHGRILRAEAESVLKKEGDFLVRDSTTPCADSPPAPYQQYVLSGISQGSKCHILLVDYDGMIRAKDEVFPSIPHLIETHVSSREPIMSGDDEIFLWRPIPKAKPYL